MKALRWFSIFAGLSLISFFMAAAHAQLANEYKPEVGQDGKDVMWVPTSQALVNKMLDMAKTTPSDYVIDLGSGDGRTVITAAKRGIKALGIEYNSDMAELSKRAASDEGSSRYRTALLWIVPAKVEGTWIMAGGVSSGELTLKQEFQKVSVSISNAITMSLLFDGKLHGDQISFIARGAQYSGTVNGNTISGTAVSGGVSREWSATRTM